MSPQSRIGWQFVRDALAIQVSEGGKRKPRGLPTAFRRANREIVDVVKREESLPANHVGNDHGYGSAFTRVAAIWGEWGIQVSARQVQDAYYALSE